MRDAYADRRAQTDSHFTTDDALRIAKALARGRRFHRSRDGYKSFCPSCDAKKNPRKTRPSLEIAARAGRILFRCYRCRAKAIDLIRELVELQLLPNRLRECSEWFVVITRVRNAMGRVNWTGTSKTTDLMVLAALLQIAERSAKLGVGASVREIAEIAQTSPATVSRALRRLRSAGWLQRVAEALHWRPAVWLPTIPEHLEAGRDQILAAGREGTVPEGNVFFHDDDRAGFTRPIAGYPHEVFRRVGLGPTKGRIYALLKTPMSAKQVANNLQYKHVRNVQVHLRSLAAAGLIRRDSKGRFHRSDASLDEIAKRLGVLGENERHRRLHQTERAQFRRWCEKLAHYKNTGEVIDPETGELLFSTTTTATPATMHRFHRLVLEGRCRIRTRVAFQRTNVAPTNAMEVRVS